MKRIIVAGGRSFNDYELLKKKLDEIIKDFKDVEIVSGHAKGADSLGERYAQEKGISCRIFPAEWKVYGKAAGPVRNHQMIDYAKEEDPILVAFWDGKSSGTKDTIGKAQKEGFQTIICYYMPLDKT